MRADVQNRDCGKTDDERLESIGDLNRSMQHLDSEYREEDVADEVQIEDLLQHRAEKPDVGSLAGRRFFA
jgi:hypothetical protein